MALYYPVFARMCSIIICYWLLIVLNGNISVNSLHRDHIFHWMVVKVCLKWQKLERCSKHYSQTINYWTLSWVCFVWSLVGFSWDPCPTVFVWTEDGPCGVVRI